VRALLEGIREGVFTSTEEDKIGHFHNVLNPTTFHQQDIDQERSNLQMLFKRLSAEFVQWKAERQQEAQASDDTTIEEIFLPEQIPTTNTGLTPQ
jgi:hypothetical protein